MATPTSAPPTQQPAMAAAQAPPEFDIAKWATFTAPPACAACQQKMQLQKPRQGPCVAVCTAAECPAKDQPLLPTAHAVHAGIAKLTAPAGHRSQAGAMAQRCKEAVDQTVADAEQLQLQLRRNSTKTDVPTNNATSAGGEPAKKKRKNKAAAQPAPSAVAAGAKAAASDQAAADAQALGVQALAYILRSCCATIELGGDCSGMAQSNLI